jgi:hypothetical protein
MFVHRRVLQGVLFLQRFVVLLVRVLMARFVVRSTDFSKSTLQGGAPTTLTLMTVVEPDDADEDGAFGKVGAESAPERVPLTRFIGDAGYLQYPVPDCQKNAPRVKEKVSVEAILPLTRGPTRHALHRCGVSMHSTSDLDLASGSLQRASNDRNG